VFIIFFIGSVAETNRAPFDLAEAESELVSGFMTEHAAVIFVFFFLAEYASIVLISIFMCVLFLGGYHTNVYFLLSFFDEFYKLFSLCFDFNNIRVVENISQYVNYNAFFENVSNSFSLGLKTSLLVFVFI